MRRWQARCGDVRDVRKEVGRINGARHVMVYGIEWCQA